jgi:hypothetical protein
LRRRLAALLVLSCVGLTAELLLTGHTEDAWQLTPLLLLAAGVLALGGHTVWPGPRTLVPFRLVMVLCLTSGVVGSYLHYRAKAEFALERRPDLRGLPLLREALKGASPPLLAPGAMILVGLLGLTWARPDTEQQHPGGHA